MGNRPVRGGILVKYEAKYRIGKNKYIAVLDKALVIVTTDDSGKPIRWAIFEKQKEEQT